MSLQGELRAEYWRGWLAGMIFGFTVGGFVGITIHAYTTNTLWAEEVE